MATVLALIEGSVLFAAVCVTIFRWAQPFLTGWLDVTAVIGQALALSLCCVVAFYYNDLYDLRIVHSLDSFVSRLLQSFGVAFILLAGFYSIFPGTRMAEGPILSSVLLTVGVLLPLRALSYAIPPEPALSGAHRGAGHEPGRAPADRGDRVTAPVPLRRGWRGGRAGQRPSRPLSVLRTRQAPEEDRRGTGGGSRHRGARRAAGATSRPRSARVSGERHHGRRRCGGLRALHGQARHRVDQTEQPALLEGLQQAAVGARAGPRCQPPGLAGGPGPVGASDAVDRPRHQARLARGPSCSSRTASACAAATSVC